MVPVLILMLTAAACGARWSDDQASAVLARHSEGERTSGDETGSATTAPGAGDDSDSGPSAGDGGGEGPGSGGDAGDVGGGDASQDGDAPGTAGGPAPCTAPSDAPGVNDSEITIGSLSSLSGPVPGLGESARSAIRAYVEFRNATGGVCGRQLVLRSADDGSDNARFRSLLNEFAPDVLAFAGGVTTGDAGGADLIDELQIPFVVTAISEVFQNAAYVFDLNPPFEDNHQPIAKYEYLHDEGVRTASIVTVALDQTRSEAVKHRAQMQASGIEIVDYQELPLQTLSFDSAARGVANSEADLMLFIYDAGNSAKMAKSIEDTDHQLMFEDYLVAYGTNFIELAGASIAEGASSWARAVPNEEPGTSEGQTNFLTWMDRVAPGVDRDQFAIDAWSSAHAVVRSIESQSGPITRDAVYRQLLSTGTFDADGLIGPIELGAKVNNGCFVGMIVRSGAWTRLAPNQGFLC